MTVETGCSGSLVALHEACRALSLGECQSAVVAGTSLILSPTMTKTMSANMIISPSGQCKTFDQSADGYGRGEAINALYLKRLDDACRDGDPIRAVILGAATNSDGWKTTISSPAESSQESLIRAAYRNAGSHDIAGTPFFECHGTGTVTGDRVEASTIARLTKAAGAVIGSVSSLGGEDKHIISLLIKSDQT